VKSIKDGRPASGHLYRFDQFEIDTADRGPWSDSKDVVFMASVSDSLLVSLLTRDASEP